MYKLITNILIMHPYQFFLHRIPGEVLRKADTIGRHSMPKHGRFNFCLPSLLHPSKPRRGLAELPFLSFKFVTVLDFASSEVSVPLPLAPLIARKSHTHVFTILMMGCRETRN
jgi:hypothetical protein